MVDKRYQRGTPGPKAWRKGSAETNLGDKSPIIAAGDALKAAATQLTSSLRQCNSELIYWYDLFPELNFKTRSNHPQLDDPKRYRFSAEAHVDASIALMKRQPMILMRKVDCTIKLLLPPENRVLSLRKVKCQARLSKKWQQN